MKLKSYLLLLLTLLVALGCSSSDGEENGSENQNPVYDLSILSLKNGNYYQVDAKSSSETVTTTNLTQELSLTPGSINSRAIGELFAFDYSFAIRASTYQKNVRTGSTLIKPDYFAIPDGYASRRNTSSEQNLISVYILPSPDFEPVFVNIHHIASGSNTEIELGKMDSTDFRYYLVEGEYFLMGYTNENGIKVIDVIDLTTKTLLRTLTFEELGTYYSFATFKDGKLYAFLANGDYYIYDVANNFNIVGSGNWSNSIATVNAIGLIQTDIADDKILLLESGPPPSGSIMVIFDFNTDTAQKIFLSSDITTRLSALDNSFTGLFTAFKADFENDLIYLGYNARNADGSEGGGFIAMDYEVNIKAHKNIGFKPNFIIIK